MKRFVALILATLMLLFALASCNSDAEQSTQSTASSTTTGENNSVKEPDTPKIPVYEGMTVSNTVPVEQTLMSGGVVTLSNHHINQKDPFGKNDGGKHFDDLIEKTFPTVDSVVDEYYAKKNADIYVLIHIDNPNNYVIQSFTLNGKVYASYMFEKGSDMELLILKYNVGDVKGVQEYTIDAIKYIDGEDIKDVIMNGEKTVKVNITPEEQPTAAITDITTEMESVGANVEITDTLGLVAKDDKISLILYDGEKILATKPLSVGKNSVKIEGLQKRTTYQFAVVAVYDGLDGRGKVAYVLTTYAFITEGNFPMSEELWEEVYFDGETINILARDGDAYTREFYMEVAEEDLDLLIAERNDEIAQNLNLGVNVSRVAYSSYDHMRDTFVSLVMSDITNDFHKYDIVAYHSYVAAQSSIRDCHANLLDQDIFPYFDFSLPCWNQSIVENTTVNNKLYFVVGAMNLSVLDNAMVIWHNESLYDRELVVKNPQEPQTMREAVMAGKWTYAEMFKWASFYENEDPYGGCGDLYGLYIPGSHNEILVNSLPYAWDLDIITTYSNGKHSFNIVDNEKLESVASMFNNLYSASGNAYTAFSNACGHGSYYHHFIEGEIVFAAGTLYPSKSVKLAMREMTDFYTVLPMPKYNEAQSQYSTTSAEPYNLMAVLNHSPSTISVRGEEISAYLQYANEYSKKYISEQYYEEIVKCKYFGEITDEEEKAKVYNEHIVPGIEFDFYSIYSPSLNDIVLRFRDAVLLDNSLEDEYKDNKNYYTAAIESLDRWLGVIN